MKKTKGFTLVEIMIVLAIMASLSVLVSRALSQAIRSKEKIQEQIDTVSRLRDAVKLMERDINLAFHYADLDMELRELTLKTYNSLAQGGGQRTQQTPPNPNLPPVGTPPATAPPTTNAKLFPGESEPEALRVDPSTFFVGRENELHFATMNQAQMSRSDRVADFIEVGYTWQDCKSIDGKTTTKCLWRRTHNWVDIEPEKGGDSLVLLEGVTEFGLKYIGPGKQDWVKDWNSKTSPESSIKDKFPTAVEISITMERKKEGIDKPRKYSMQIVAPIHFPNNGVKTTTDLGGSGSLPTGPTNPLGTPPNPGIPPGGTN